MTEKYRNPLLYIEVIDVSSMREVCDMSRLTQFPFYISLSAALRESIKTLFKLCRITVVIRSFGTLAKNP